MAPDAPVVLCYEGEGQQRAAPRRTPYWRTLLGMGRKLSLHGRRICGGESSSSHRISHGEGKLFQVRQVGRSAGGGLGRIPHIDENLAPVVDLCCRGRQPETSRSSRMWSGRRATVRSARAKATPRATGLALQPPRARGALKFESCAVRHDSGRYRSLQQILQVGGGLLGAA